MKLRCACGLDKIVSKSGFFAFCPNCDRVQASEVVTESEGRELVQTGRIRTKEDDRYLVALAALQGVWYTRTPDEKGN